MFENNSAYLETVMTLIGERLEIHLSYSQLYFSTCLISFFINKLNSLSATSNLISVSATKESHYFTLRLSFLKLHVISPVSTSISCENTIETSLRSRKYHLAKLGNVNA